VAGTRQPDGAVLGVLAEMGRKRFETDVVRLCGTPGEGLSQESPRLACQWTDPPGCRR